MVTTTQTLNYDCNGQEHIGYAAWNESATASPLVIVIHEWWGVNDYIRSRVDQLAAQGYTAVAIDMFGGGRQAADPTEANELMTSVLQDMETGTARLKAGLAAAQGLASADSSRTAAIGYCFGGAMALHMARIGLPLKTCVSFHGALGSFHKPAKGEVQASILVCHGEADAMVSMDDVDAFKQEMDKAGADYEVITYADAKHGFSSREADVNGEKYGLPVGYQQAADEDSWNAMLELFKRELHD